jgi:hypothetical protein
MTTVEVVPTCDTAIEKDDNLTHLVCRYDVPLQGNNVSQNGPALWLRAI